MAQEQTCNGCGGTGMTDKIVYEIELDENGNQKAVARHIMTPCSRCGGSGRLV